MTASEKEMLKIAILNYQLDNGKLNLKEFVPKKQKLAGGKSDG